MKTLILIPILALVAGCNSTSFKATKPDGTTVSISNTRFLFATENYSATLTTNGATLSATKSGVDGEAGAAIVAAAIKASK
jgi:hypothetical protein